MVIITKIQTKPRPRATTFGGHTHLYTPKTALSYERYIASEYQRLGGKFYGESKLMVCIHFYFKLPQNTPKWKVWAIESKHDKYCEKHKDLDNLVKSVLDGLNTVAFNDDKQIVSLYCTKQWTNDQERIELEIHEIPVLPDNLLKEKYKNE